METGLVLLAYIAPLLLGHNTIVDDFARIEEAQAIIIEQQMKEAEEQRLQEEKEKILNETMTEGVITRMEELGRIRYRLGRFDEESNAFDCVGLLKAYAVKRGLLTAQEAGYINSTVMYLLGNKKDLSEAVRGDVTYRSPLGNETLKHIAIVTRDYDSSEGGIWIIDNAPGNGGKVEERFLQMRGDVFVGKRKILIASSPFVEIAKNKGLEYEPLWSYEGMFELSRYYSPEPNQSSYQPYDIDYEAALIRNCGGDCKYLSDEKGRKFELTNKYIEKVVACPPKYPKGTKLMIEDWIEVVCLDRGGDIKKKRLDIRAGVGQLGYDNIKENNVVTGRRNIYKQNLHSKPINESTKILRITDSFGNYGYFAKK